MLPHRSPGTRSLPGPPYPWVATVLGLCLTLATNARAQTASGCSATDYAPESIAVLTQPSMRSGAIRTVPRGEVASLVNVDAVGDPRGDWLKVRSGKQAGWVSAKNVACRLAPDAAHEVLALEAVRVVAALKAANMTELARHVHPTKGLRLSPHATVDAEADVVLTAAKLRLALQDTRQRTWGFDDGSGKPIRLPFRRYYRRFVYDRDFAAAAQITYNAPGEGVRKAWEAYPNAVVADFQVPVNQSPAPTSLRLVFEQHREKWYLVGIIHDAWTI